MTSIPLLCNICPKEPQFSDISHLLTHVASKGHLAQGLKAKVRSRQDASIRERLDTYDRWYERHQIEKLLSQRLMLKESKDSGSRVKRPAKSPPAPSTKNVRPRKKCAKTSDKLPQGSPLKPEAPPIDPQLSWFPPSSPSPFLSPPGYGGLPQYDQASNHDYNIPRMFDGQDDDTNGQANLLSTPSKVPNRPKSLLGPGLDTDSENDYFRTFIRSPTMTAYPDPSELPGLPFDFSPPQTTEYGREHAILTPDPKSGNFGNAESMQLPVLKGVKWPGMSIFDSASLEAQRLRNQKKDGSILEQMEHNSSVVEQLERIYWPDGSLKLERLITGNVESSPMKEPTPQPKGQRTRAKKTVLKDLSTNAPKQTRRARKMPGQLHTTQVSDLRKISKKALATLDPPPPRFVYPRTAHMGYDAANEADLERRLTSGRIHNTRRQEFDVFNDNVTTDDLKNAQPGTRPAKSGTKTEDYSFMRNTHGHQDPHHLQGNGLPARRTPFAPMRPSAGRQSRVQHDGLPWKTQPETSQRISKPFTAEEDSENIEPILDSDGRVDIQVSRAYNERVTQRYFSVSGNQPPQFFDSLPPHMDFGGFGGPRYQGSTLNLLNPYLHQQHLPSRYSPVLFHRPDPSCRTGLQKGIGKGGRPVVGKEEGSKEDGGSRP